MHIKIPDTIIKKLEQDYRCQITAEKRTMDYSPEVPTKILLPKLYEGVIIVSLLAS